MEVLVYFLLTSLITFSDADSINLAMDNNNGGPSIKVESGPINLQVGKPLIAQGDFKGNQIVPGAPNGIQVTVSPLGANVNIVGSGNGVSSNKNIPIKSGNNVAKNNVIPHGSGNNIVKNNIIPPSSGNNVVKNNIIPPGSGNNVVKNNIIHPGSGNNVAKNNIILSGSGNDVAKNNIIPPGSGNDVAKYDIKPPGSGNAMGLGSGDSKNIKLPTEALGKPASSSNAGDSAIGINSNGVANPGKPFISVENGISATSNAANQGSKELPWKQWRLPSNIVPLHYTITLKPNLTTGYFEGSCNIQVQVGQPSKHIVLHSNGLNYSHVALVKGDLPEGQPIKIAKHFVSPEFEYFVMVLDGDLEADKLYEVQLKFSGVTQDEQLVGLYRSKYTNIDGQEKFVALTKFQPTDARRVFPCFDEPEFKATFSVSVIHEPKYTALGNMPSIKSDMMDDGLINTEFSKSVLMSSYLVAIIISEFKFKSGKTKSGTEVRVHAREEQIQATTQAVKVAVSALEFFSDYFGIPYPLPKSDLVAIPDFKDGAMENWGLISFRETSLLYNPADCSIADKESAMETTIHELGHMWFGNLVTMKWWDNLWLNEGFAKFSEQLAGAFIEPTWHLHEKFIPRIMDKVMSDEEGAQSRAIVNSVNKPQDINGLFDTITYEKGASVIYMLETILGTDHFQTGLKNYLNTFKFNNTVTLDLWIKFSEASNPKLDVAKFMDTWTKQEGFPVVQINFNPEITNEVKATQQRYFSMPDDSLNLNLSTSPFNYLWEVPLTYRNPNNNKFEIQWLKQNKHSTFLVNQLNNPIKFNVNGSGYYRVNYQEEAWFFFANVLNENHNYFTVTDRANLLDDVFSLSKGGYINYYAAFALVKYLPKERDDVPLLAVVPHLIAIAQRLEATETYIHFRNFSINLLIPIYNKLGWEPQKDYIELSSQILILKSMCTLGYPPCLSEAVKQFQAWKAGNLVVPPDLRVIVYKFGMQNSFNVDDWEYMWNAYSSPAGSAHEKNKYLTALASTRVPWLIYRLLSNVKDPNKIRSQDFFTVLKRLADNPVAVQMVWDYIQTDWENIVKRFSLNSNHLGRPFSAVAESFSSPYRLKQMEDFIKKYPDIGAGQLERKKALDSVKRNIEWMNRCLSQIEGSLAKIMSTNAS